MQGVEESLSCRTSTSVVKGKRIALGPHRRRRCGLTVLSKSYGSESRSAFDDAQYEQKVKEDCGERVRETKPTESFALPAKNNAGRKEMPNKNDAYDSPASARSSARSRSASTMANLRATCINDYIHTRFLTICVLPCLPTVTSPPLKNSGGGETARTPASRCRRHRNRNWKSYGPHGDFFSCVMHTKFTD